MSLANRRRILKHFDDDGSGGGLASFVLHREP